MESAFVAACVSESVGATVGETPVSSGAGATSAMSAPAVVGREGVEPVHDERDAERRGERDVVRAVAVDVADRERPRVVVRRRLIVSGVRRFRTARHRDDADVASRVVQGHDVGRRSVDRADCNGLRIVGDAGERADGRERGRRARVVAQHLDRPGVERTVITT